MTFLPIRDTPQESDKNEMNKIEKNHPMFLFRSLLPVRKPKSNQMVTYWAMGGKLGIWLYKY